MLTQRYALPLALVALAAPAAYAAAPNSFVLNEANTISGGRFIDKGRGDPFFSSPATSTGRLEGHGQNWFEFLVVQGDEMPGGSFKNALDLRGWTLEWQYDKQDPTDPDQFGHGTIQFTDDPLWAAVPTGTLLTVSEWQQAWYASDTPFEYDPWGAGGLARAGGINGLGNQRGTTYNETIHTLLDLSTDVSWNPHTDDWHMHVYAGERNPDQSLKYFNFTGSVTDGDDTYAIGTDQAGQFALNNDNWQWTIKDAEGEVIQGPFGEEDTGLPGSSWSLSAQEIIKLEAFATGTGATVDSYLGVGIADYRDGSTGSFGQPNSWSSGGGFQDLSMLRNWLPLPGDANLDGVVDSLDYLAWKSGFGIAQGALLHQGDFNGDGMVDAADYTIWRNNLGAGATPLLTVAGGAAVPEPSSVLLCGLALIGWLSVRQRRP